MIPKYLLAYTYKESDYSLPKIGDKMDKERLDSKPVLNSLDDLFLIVFIPREKASICLLFLTFLDLNLT